MAPARRLSGLSPARDQPARLRLSADILPLRPDQIELHLLPFDQLAKARALDGADMDEGVLAAVIGLDEAETLGRVEPLHGVPLSWEKALHSVACSPHRAGRQIRIFVGSKSEAGANSKRGHGQVISPSIDPLDMGATDLHCKRHRLLRRRHGLAGRPRSARAGRPPHPRASVGWREGPPKDQAAAPIAERARPCARR